MEGKDKTILSVLISLIVLFFVVNLPIIAYGYDTCLNQTEYESLMAYEFPCALCGGANVETIFFHSGTLYSGVTATNSTPATSELVSDDGGFD